MISLQYAVDKLYEAGWIPTDPGVCQHLPTGRLYPPLATIHQTFAAGGFELVIRHVQLFDCYRAVWTDATGAAAGAVVGADESEAAVFALAQFLKSQLKPKTKPLSHCKAP